MKQFVSKFKIRHFYPIVIVLFVILISAFILVWSGNTETERVLDEQVVQAKVSALKFQKILEESYRGKSLNFTDQVMELLSAEAMLEVAWVSRENGIIDRSTNDSLQGMPVSDVLRKMEIDPDFVQAKGALITGARIIATAPVMIEAEKGNLVIVYNIQEARNQIGKKEGSHIALFSLLFLATFFGVSFFLYHSAIDRLDYLRKNFLAFALGKRGIQFTVYGNDEIAEISESLHEMALLVEREEKLLLEKEKLLTDMVGNLQGVAYKCLDYAGRQITFISNGCIFLTGYMAHDFTSPGGVNFETLMDKEDHQKLTELIQIQLRKKGRYEVTYRIRHRGGLIRWVMDQGTGIFEEGKLISREGLAIDITKSKEAELEVLERDRQINQYVDIIDLYVITSKTTPEGIITYASDAFAQISGYSKEELIGKKHNLLRHPDIPTIFYEEMWKVLKTGSVWRGEIKNRRKNGDSYWVDVCITPTLDNSGKAVEFTSVSKDITDRKKIEEIAITDELTGLFNRRFFNQSIARELSRANREGKMFVFVMADVDFFKRYNDNYGHQKGDQVLIKIGEAIRQTFKRAGDFSFRLGGEEFGIFWHANDYEGVVRVVSVLRWAVEQLQIPHAFSDVSKSVTISIGVCVTRDNFSQDVVYKNADEALYEAKHSGRNQIKYKMI